MIGDDKVTVISGKDGTEIENVVCTVTPDTTVIEGASIIIEPGDLIVRVMSNGAKETYRVIDPQFYEVDGGTYVVKHKKLGVPETESALQNISYNISGSHARVNHQSIDNSINQTNIGSDLSEKIESLKFEILNHTDGQQQKDALQIVSAVEQQLSSEAPSSIVVSTLLKGLPTVGNVASIASLILAFMA